MLDHLVIDEYYIREYITFCFSIGAGKSTFIEALGIRYVNKGSRVAVIPVDPSSHINGGSILGDKTRMEQLSKSDKAYVRGSPTRGVLGGIAEHTSDVISLCESGKVV